MRTRHVIYAGPAFAGRSTSLLMLCPRSARGQAMRQLLRAAAEFSFAGAEVRATVVNFGHLWFPSIAAARAASEPWVRERVERLAEYLPLADGVVFVADSQPERFDANVYELEQLLAFMREEGVDPARVPFVFQLNKRDLRGAATVDALRQALSTPRCAHVESVAAHGHGVARALATVFALADGEVPELRDDDVREEIRVRATGLTLALAGPAAMAAIWPKELLGTFAVRPGLYAIELFLRGVEFDGPSGATRVVSVAGGRARLVGARPLRVEVLKPGQRHPFRTLIGTPAAVDAAQQDLLPSDSYHEAAQRGIAVADYHDRFVPAKSGVLAILDATAAPWIGRDEDGAIVELGAANPNYDDLPERSIVL